MLFTYGILLKNSLEDVYEDKNSRFPAIMSAINLGHFITSTGFVYFYLMNTKRFLVIWGFVILHLFIVSSMWIIYAFQHENRSSVLITKLLRDRIIHGLEIGKHHHLQNIPNDACHFLEHIHTSPREIGEYLFEDPSIGVQAEECVKALATEYNKWVYISTILTYVELYLFISNYMWIVAYYYAKERLYAHQR
ncbi:hypothetical protein RF11_12806 [Thelohanellus kitauei]|uniref:Uncharacterized protein n=1 Tax=Thelohanellus kitauei TaxID=669202 RepID=A0A0C2IWZ1_THEKT|nr:hypothetical protein RF11_12806 [Thelohanellus kitauei]